VYIFVVDLIRNIINNEEYNNSGDYDPNASKRNNNNNKGNKSPQYKEALGLFSNRNISLIRMDKELKLWKKL